MEFTTLFQMYDRRVSSKLVTNFLCFLKSEYDLDSNQKARELVNKFLNEIELPVEVFAIILIPTFQTIQDLLIITQKDGFLI